MPAPFVRSKPWVYGHLLAGIVGLNPAGVGCLSLVSCVLLCWSLIQRSNAEFGMSN